MTEPQQIVSDLLWFWPEGEIDHDKLGRAAIDRLEAAGFRIEPASKNVRGMLRLLELPVREITHAAEYAYELVAELDSKRHRKLHFAVERLLAMVQRLETHIKGRG
jgi:hypothetical protein